jgi:predicted DNA binding CopG/RHH family protein
MNDISTKDILSTVIPSKSGTVLVKVYKHDKEVLKRLAKAEGMTMIKYISELVRKASK